VKFLFPGTLFLFAGCLFNGSTYSGSGNPHYIKDRFENIEEHEYHGFLDLLYWRLTRDPGHWDDYRDYQPGPAPPAAVGQGHLRVTFINHATVLVQMDGMNVLTDPIYSLRASPLSFAGPHRVRPPGIRMEDLPHIDAVIISHNHYDHMDLATLQILYAKFSMPVFVGLGNGKLLRDAGIGKVQEVSWWGSYPLSRDVRLFSVPVQHFSRRGMTDGDQTLWTGYALAGPAGLVYFAGDTGYAHHFQQVKETFGEVTLAILPIGAYLPRWFMNAMHISPEEAVQAHIDLGASYSIPMHYGTFPLGDDGQTRPIEDLKKALVEKKVDPARFRILDFGEGWDIK